MKIKIYVGYNERRNQRTVATAEVVYKAPDRAELAYVDESTYKAFPDACDYRFYVDSDDNYYAVPIEDDIFTADSFGSDIPDNWEEICSLLNAYSAAHPQMDTDEIWEAYWNGSLEV